MNECSPAVRASPGAIERRFCLLLPGRFSRIRHGIYSFLVVFTTQSPESLDICILNHWFSLPFPNKQAFVEFLVLSRCLCGFCILLVFSGSVFCPMFSEPLYTSLCGVPWPPFVVMAGFLTCLPFGLCEAWVWISSLSTVSNIVLDPLWVCVDVYRINEWVNQ